MILSARSLSYIPIMVFENFTSAARLVIVASQEEARKDRSALIGGSHLLVALAAPLGTDSSQALALLGASEAEIRAKVKGHRRKGLLASPAHIPFTSEVRQVILAAVREADARGEGDVGSGDLLLALARKSRLGGQILVDLGADLEALVNALAQAAPAEDLTAEPEDGPHPAMPRPVSGNPGPDQPPKAPGQVRVPVMLSVRCSESVTVSPERAWSLLGSPRAWSLVKIVTQCVDRQLTVTQSLDQLPTQTTYLLSQAAEGTRLEMIRQVPAPLVAVSGTNRRNLVDFPRKWLTGYKTYIETGSGSAD
jgi:Clp amino terminal domain, pathogenicity island component